jgi:hypothetical protein
MLPTRMIHWRHPVSNPKQMQQMFTGPPTRHPPGRPRRVSNLALTPRQRTRPSEALCAPRPPRRGEGWWPASSQLGGSSPVMDQGWRRTTQHPERTDGRASRTIHNAPPQRSPVVGNPRPMSSTDHRLSLWPPPRLSEPPHVRPQGGPPYGQELRHPSRRAPTQQCFPFSAPVTTPSATPTHLCLFEANPAKGKDK